MAITYYQANKIMDYNFGGTDYILPDNYYIGLSTTAINADGTGATEPVGNGYARVEISNDKVNFGVSANGSLTNLSLIIFPQASGSWGSITHILFSDSLSGGNILFYDALTTPKTIGASEVGVFVASSLNIGLS